MPKENTVSAEVWSLSGAFMHWVYGPKGEAQGLMLDVGGVPVQFVFPPHLHADFPEALLMKHPLTLEGSAVKPSPKHPAEHEVYELVRVVEPKPSRPQKQRATQAFSGTVARFNFARHGEPNGVVLGNGDFIHTKPHGLALLKLKVGDGVTAEGHSRPLFTGDAVVVEAYRVNGVPLA